MPKKNATKRPSGPSGQHKNPSALLRAKPEEWAAWKASADAHGLNLTTWIRLACNRQTERKTLG